MMRFNSRLLLPLLLLLLPVAEVRAQVPDTVRGRIVDAAGEPLAGERVLLHRVQGMSGATIAEARSDADGRFLLPVDSADNADATYFLAARWGGELYIGDIFRAPFGPGEHILRVGVPGTSASAMFEGTAPAMAPGSGATLPARGGTGGGMTWLLFAVPLVLLLGVIVYLALRRRQAIPERRRLLIEVAELDLQHEGSPGEEYRARRAELIARLHDLTA